MLNILVPSWSSPWSRSQYAFALLCGAALPALGRAFAAAGKAHEDVLLLASSVGLPLLVGYICLQSFVCRSRDIGLSPGASLPLLALSLAALSAAHAAGPGLLLLAFALGLVPGAGADGALRPLLRQR